MELLSAVKNNMVPLQEYLLQGSILEAHRDVLLHRLNGLCDNVESGPERFHDHEMVYQIRAHGVAPMNLRVRRALDVDHQDAPWHLRYIGQPDMGDKSRHTLVRAYIDVGTTDNIVTFLKDMGFKLDYEYVVRGYLFRKGRMKIAVSKIFKMVQPEVTDNVEPVSMSYLVELSVVANQAQEKIQDDMRTFAEQLKPLVQLDKVDHKRLQTQP